MGRIFRSFCRGNTFPDDFLHLGHLFEHILGQGDLAAGTFQIVLGRTDLEIQVAVQIVRKEPAFYKAANNIIAFGFNFINGATPLLNLYNLFMEHKTNVMRVLDAAEITYKHYSYDAKEALSGTEVAACLKEDPAQVFKTLVTCGKSRAHYVFLIPSRVCDKSGNFFKLMI